VLRISIWGTWSFASEGYPHQSPPVAMGLCGKTLACFLMQFTQKTPQVTQYVNLARYVKVSVYKHDRAQNGATHSGSVYSAS